MHSKEKKTRIGHVDTKWVQQRRVSLRARRLVAMRWAVRAKPRSRNEHMLPPCPSTSLGSQVTRADTVDEFCKGGIRRKIGKNQLLTSHSSEGYLYVWPGIGCGNALAAEKGRVVRAPEKSDVVSVPSVGFRVFSEISWRSWRDQLRRILPSLALFGAICRACSRAEQQPRWKGSSSSVGRRTYRRTVS
jgi:hypothetical protein